MALSDERIHEILAILAPCWCDAPNNNPYAERGPLKDGSHLSNCPREELGDDVIDTIGEVEREARDEALEEAALRVRAVCHVCAGTGTIESWRDTETLRVLECEFCAKPMAAIRALKSQGAP